MTVGELPDYDEGLRPLWHGSRREAEGNGRERARGAGGELVRIHDHLRAESRELLSVVEDFIAGRGAITRARTIIHELSSRQGYSAVGSFCSGFCMLLTMHHQIEDRQVFPGLGRVEPDVVPVLRRLMEEHEVIAEIVGRVLEAIELADSDCSNATVLKEIAEHLYSRLSSHLRYEEAQLVEILDLHGF